MMNEAIHNLRSPRTNSGFSLVELMVAMLLGSIVVLAVTQLFITNQRTFQLQRGLTDVQEQGRFAIDYISRDVRRVGLRQFGAIPGPAPGVVRDAAITVNGVNFPPSTEGGNGLTDNDRLTFTFQGLAGMEDCEGDALSNAAAPALVANTYWVNNAGQLMCRGSVNAGSGGIVIVDGVDSFQVLYGVDTELDGVPFASRYVRADELGANEVVTIRVGMLLRATQEQLPELADPINYIVLDKELESGQAPLDTRAVRRLFVTTVRARNFRWESI